MDIRSLKHSKSNRIEISKGVPSSNQGNNGELRLGIISKGIFLYVKYGNRWYQLGDAAISAGGQFSAQGISSQGAGTLATSIDRGNQALNMGGNVVLSGNTISDTGSNTGVKFEDNATLAIDVATTKIGTNQYMSLADNEIDISSGNLTLDVAGNIIADVAGGQFTIQDNTNGDPDLVIKCTSPDAVADIGGSLIFEKNKDGTGANSADNDVLGLINFEGYNDAGTPAKLTYAQIYSQAGDVTEDSEAGILKLNVITKASGGSGAQTGFQLTGSDTNDEIDVTIGAGTASMTTIAGNLDIDGATITSPSHLTIRPSGDHIVTATRNINLNAMTGGSGGVFVFNDSSAYTPASANEVVPKHYLDANTYHFIKCGFYVASSAKHYLPIAANDDLREVTNPSGAPEKVLFICPYNGSVEKVLARSEEACGSSILGIHIASDGTEIPSTTATQTVTVDMAADDTSYEFDFASAGTNTFTKGQVIMFSFDPTNNMNDISFTIVLKFDVST